MSKNKLITTERVLTSALALTIGAAVVDSLKSPAALNPTNEGVAGMGVKIDVKPVDANRLVSSKTGGLHKVTYKFDHGEQGIKSMVDADFPNQDITEATDNVASYLPEAQKKGKIIHPNETLTVYANSDGHVVPNPNPEDSAPGN